MMGSIAFRVKDSESLPTTVGAPKRFEVPVWSIGSAHLPTGPKERPSQQLPPPTITPNLLLLHGNLLAVRPSQTAGRFPFG